MNLSKNKFFKLSHRKHNSRKTYLNRKKHRRGPTKKKNNKKKHMKNTTVKIYIGGGNCSEDPIKKFIKNLKDTDLTYASETRKNITDLIKDKYNEKFITDENNKDTDKNNKDIESYTLNINNTTTTGYIKKISENGNCLYNSFAFAYLFNNNDNNNNTPNLSKWIPQEDFSKNIYSGNLRNVLAEYICENSGNIIESQIVTQKNLDEALDRIIKVEEDGSSSRDGWGQDTEIQLLAKMSNTCIVVYPKNDADNKEITYINEAGELSSNMTNCKSNLMHIVNTKDLHYEVLFILTNETDNIIIESMKSLSSYSCKDLSVLNDFIPETKEIAEEKFNFLDSTLGVCLKPTNNDESNISHQEIENKITKNQNLIALVNSYVKNFKTKFGSDPVNYSSKIEDECKYIFTPENVNYRKIPNNQKDANEKLKDLIAKAIEFENTNCHGSITEAIEIYTQQFYSKFPTGPTAGLTGPTAELTGPTGAIAELTGSTGAIAELTGSTGATAPKPGLTGPTGATGATAGVTGVTAGVTGPPEKPPKPDKNSIGPTGATRSTSGLTGATAGVTGPPEKPPKPEKYASTTGPTGPTGPIANKIETSTSNPALIPTANQVKIPTADPIATKTNEQKVREKIEKIKTGNSTSDNTTETFPQQANSVMSEINNTFNNNTNDINENVNENVNKNVNENENENENVTLTVNEPSFTAGGQKQIYINLTGPSSMGVTVQNYAKDTSKQTLINLAKTGND